MGIIHYIIQVFMFMVEASKQLTLYVGCNKRCYTRAQIVDLLLGTYPLRSGGRTLKKYHSSETKHLSDDTMIVGEGILVLGCCRHLLLVNIEPCGGDLQSELNCVE